MLEEAMVLRGDHGLNQDGRELGERKHRAILPFLAVKRGDHLGFYCQPLERAPRGEGLERGDRVAGEQDPRRLAPHVTSRVGEVAGV